MKIDVEIDIGEAREILEEYLSRKFGADIGQIAICSYEMQRIVFERDGMVEAVPFRHRIK